MLTPSRCHVVRFVVTFLAVLANGFVAPSAHAAPTADQLTREALLRGYTTEGAERRYRELQNRQITASTTASNALASGVGALAANMEKRMQANNERLDRFYALMEAGLDVPMQVQSDLDTVKKMFADVVDSEKYNMAVRRRLIEYALHMRPRSEQVFPTRNASRAAEVLRRNAYDPANFYPWAAHMLAKLYLTGMGVPQDEGEAFRLLNECGLRPARFVPSVSWTIPADVIACKLTLAEAHRFGWGTSANGELADQIDAIAVDDYRKLMGGKPASLADVREVLQ